MGSNPAIPTIRMTKPRVDQLFAFLADDDRGEGLVQWGFPGIGTAPLVGADLARIESLRRFAQAIANERGKPVTLAFFSERRDVETILPEPRR